MKKSLNLVSFLTLFLASPIFANGLGQSSGLFLLDPTHARVAALGEAFTATTDDISAMQYNPATLRSLVSGQTSLFYEKGILDDSSAFIQAGFPIKKGGLGISFGAYNGGRFEKFDGQNTKDVTGKKDLFTSIGYAKDLGQFGIGFTLKYLQSDLVEQFSAKTFTSDIGLFVPASSHLNLGLALQNIGGQLQYQDEKNSLPRIARIGGSALIFNSPLPTQLFLDFPYFLNEKQLETHLGLETILGPLSMRIGSKLMKGKTDLTVGSGFKMGQVSLDYSFGFIEETGHSQKLSLTYRFGTNETRNKFEVENIKRETPHVVQFESNPVKMPKITGKRIGHRIYIVKKGDSLSGIANKIYGHRSDWKKIYAANQDALQNENSLVVGLELILP